MISLLAAEKKKTQIALMPSTGIGGPIEGEVFDLLAKILGVLGLFA